MGFTSPYPGFQGFKLYLHGDGVTDPIYRQYVPTTPGDINTLVWSTQGWAAFGSEVIGSGDPVATVDLFLADGVLGDSTDADDEIVHVGGPALFVPEPGLAASLLSGLLMLRWLERMRRGMGLPLW